MAQSEKPPTGNSMGDILNNKGIITQGQQGNNTIINAPPRDPKGFYQNDTKIGRSDSVPKIDAASGIAVFNRIALSAVPDSDQPIEYGDLILACSDFRIPQHLRSAATVGISIGGPVPIKIIGRR
jgi:hypothetical protein